MHIPLTTTSLKEYVLKLLKRHPIKTIFLYSLLSELLVLLFLFLAFLLTTEILLPGFISLRLNLTWYLIAILTVTFFLAFIGQNTHIQPSQKIRFEKLLITISGFWALGIIALSLHHFPWWTIAFLLILLCITSLWAWRFLFRNIKNS